MSQTVDPLILDVYKQAVTSCVVDLKKARALQDRGLLVPTTNFRRYFRYPGEVCTLDYDFTLEGYRHRGYLGFDKNLRLITIDQRSPQRMSSYYGQI